MQDVDARLWPDPLAVVERADLADRNKARVAPEDDIHSPCAILKKLAQSDLVSDPTAINELTVLAVMLPGGPYAENAESRRRTRYATVSGLRAKEFVPHNDEHLGYLRVRSLGENVAHLPGCKLDATDAIASGIAGPANSEEEYFTVPFERFNSRYLPGRGRALVLWLNSEKFEKKPLTNIASLLNQVIPVALPECPDISSELGQPPCLRIRILGPRGSTNFRELLEELVVHWGNGWKAFSEKSPHVLGALKAKPRFYSYSATIADERLYTILEQSKLPGIQRFQAEKPIPFKTIEEFLALSEVTDHVAVLRTINQDDVLADALVKELARRRVIVDEHMINVPDATGIALVSEWDTLFGRVLPSTICTAFVRKYIEEKKEALKKSGVRDIDAALKSDTDRAKNCASVNPPEGFAYFSYLRGLDGKGAQGVEGESKDASKKVSAKGENDGARSDAEQIENAEGQGQFDYLRRLSAAMKRKDLESRAVGLPGYRAIGVVGSDVYDKLIVLQVLRAQFPEAIFFTTDLDARLLHPSENKWARNLIVASSFGFELDTDEQRFIPPFRDSYQTSAFLATKIALTPQSSKKKEELTDGKVDGEKSDAEKSKESMPFDMNQKAMRDRLGDARVFEVGSRGIVDISPYVPKSRCEGKTDICLHARATTFDGPQKRTLKFLLILLTLICLCASAVALLSRRMCKRIARTLAGLYAILTCWRTKRTARYLRAYHRIARTLTQRHARCMILAGLLIASLLAIAFGPRLLAAVFNWLSEDGSGEPFSWFDGVSIWPTELIRLIALFSALYFIARGWSKLEENRRSIMRRFDLRRTEKAIECDLTKRPLFSSCQHNDQKFSSGVARRWRRLKRYFMTAFSSPRYRYRPEKDDDSGMRGRLEPNAIAFWRKYVYLNRWHVRVLRIVALFLVLFIFNLVIFQIFGRPVAPVRGTLGAALDYIILMSTVIAFQFLTIAALDATILCFRLITELRDQQTVWPDDARERMARKLQLKLGGRFGEAAVRVIDEWLDIQIIAKRSEAVVRLIYYPMIVLSLMILARNTAFDNWVLTPALLIVYTTNAFVVVVAALMLRRAAESSRTHSLRVIRDSLSHYRLGGERGKPFADHVEQLARQIEGMDNGAFARFSQQPMVRSVLLLVGSVGGTSLLELTALLNF